MLLKNNLGFSIWIYVFGFSRCNGLIICLDFLMSSRVMSVVVEVYLGLYWRYSSFLWGKTEVKNILPCFAVFCKPCQVFFVFLFTHNVIICLRPVLLRAVCWSSCKKIYPFQNYDIGFLFLFYFNKIKMELGKTW